MPNCDTFLSIIQIITKLHSNLTVVNDIKKTELKIRKVLFVSSILFALFFAVMLIYFISVHEKWLLCVAMGVLMVSSAINAVQLFRAIKRNSSE